MKRRQVMQQYKDMPDVAKASLWFFFCSIVQKAVTMLTIPIVTRMLTTSEYGVYSVFNSYGNILIAITTLNLSGNGYYVGMKRYGEDKKRYTASITSLMLINTTIVFCTCLIFRKWVIAISGLRTIIIVIMFVQMYGQGAINLWFVENRYEYKYRMIVICTLAMAISTPIVKILLIYVFGLYGLDKSTAAIIGLVFPIIIIGAIAYLCIYYTGRVFYIKEYWKFGIIFNIPLVPYYLSQNILNQADRIMIERLDSAGSAGIYSVAYSLASTIMIVNSAVNNTLIPWQFQMMKKGNSKLIVKTVNKIMLGIAAMHLLLIIISPEIMRIFAAKEYMDAIYIIPPVTIGVLLIWLTQNFINIEFFYEKNKLIALSSVLSAVLNVALNRFAIPKFGYLAAGWTTLICYLANMIFHGIVAVVLSRRMRIERAFDLGKISFLTLSCIVVMMLVIFLYKVILLRYGVLLGFFSFAFIKRNTLSKILMTSWSEIRKKDT